MSYSKGLFLNIISNNMKQNLNFNKIISIWKNFLGKDIFYVPVLGPVNVPSNCAEKLLLAVLENSKTDKFLPYDKNRRWFQKKMEKIILPEIFASEEEIFIPAKNNLWNYIKVYYYSNKFPDNAVIEKARKLYTKTKLSRKANQLYFYSFKRPKINTKFNCLNIYLKRITKKDNLNKLPEGINYYDDLPKEVQQTFGDFTKEPELGGLDFLWKKFITKNKKLSPIICATKKNKIVGSAGSTDIAADICGAPFLFPPCLGVAKKMRRSSIGEKLWKSAMSYATQKGAKYTLVQNMPDSPASRFYEKQGLINIGRVYSCVLD